MKIIISIFLFSQFLYSQSYSIVYEMEQTDNRINFKTKLKTYLDGNNELSFYEEDFKRSRENFIENSDARENLHSMTNNNVYYKNRTSNTILYRDHIRFKFFNINDSLDSFEWKLGSEKKTILGYDCQKATTIFRGRKFEVYFTNDIPINDGPYKFYGLPGLILEVYSEDDIATIKIEVIQINLNSEKQYSIPYFDSRLKNISYQEYKKLYQEKYEESLFKVVNEKGETRPMSKGFFEYYVD